MIEVAIALGLFLSLLSYEILGIAAGGIVVPGYIALHLAYPEKLIGVFLVSFLTFLIVRGLKNYMFLYGRRQMVLSVLIGCLLAITSRQLFKVEMASVAVQLEAVGWVIPGLIAHWFCKQGIYKTMCAVLLVSVLVRLIVILIFGGEPFPS